MRPTASHAPRGYTIMTIMVLMAVGVTFAATFTAWTISNIRAIQHTRYRELALLIAESGVEYYRWHLAHAPTDFQDGTNDAGPYIHDYADDTGERIGTFSLEITPPEAGSTVVTIRSTGQVDVAPSVRRIVEVTLAKPSFAQFAAVANSEMRFGEGTEIFGRVHSNGGIRFDGFAHNLVTSSLNTYNDPDHSGSPEYAVHTHISPVDPLPPSPLPDRPDVFAAGREVGVPQVDFNGLSSDFSAIRSLAQENGRYHASSGSQGYRILLRTNDTYDLYRVTSIYTAHPSCSAQGQPGWGSWSINNETFVGNYSFPINGLIFVEDHLWIEGQIETARITVAAARFPENPSNWRNIMVNNNLLYTHYDGRDVIALLAQGNFNVGLQSSYDLRIDAAIIAQNGRVGRPYYQGPGSGQDRCGPHDTKGTITLHGMIGTNERYGFAYTDGTGYQIRNLFYDSNLLLNAPPSFPLTSDHYIVTTWREAFE